MPKPTPSMAKTDSGISGIYPLTGHIPDITKPTRVTSRPRDFHPRALPEPAVNHSIQTAPDVRPLPWQSGQWANSVGFARRSRSNQSLAPLVQWCFAALTTVEPILVQILMIAMSGGADAERRAEMVKTAGRLFDGPERRLDAVNGSAAPISLSPTFSLPPSCGRSARPNSSIPIPGRRPIMSGPWRARPDSALSTLTRSG
jgi:hypothetical protein